MIALEEIGCPYRTELVTFATGHHRSPGYLATNPFGKVPVLVVDGQPLTENIAILTWLAAKFPEAALLPASIDPFDRALVTADLAMCGAGLHPIVTRLRIPHWFCDLPDATPRVFALAASAMDRHLAVIEQRFAASHWWYGERWSAIDAYINWVWFRVAGTAYDVSAYPSIARHHSDMLARPAVARALAKGQEAAADLEARGLAVRFAGPGAIVAPTRP